MESPIKDSFQPLSSLHEVGKLFSFFGPIALALIGLIAAPLTGVLKDETPSCLLDI